LTRKHSERVNLRQAADIFNVVESRNYFVMPELFPTIRSVGFCQMGWLWWFLSNQATVELLQLGNFQYGDL